MWSVGIALSAALAALAWQVARVRPAHRTIAALVTLGVLVDVGRRLAAVLVFEPARAARLGPFTGAVRALFHVDQALFLAWPAALAIVGLGVLLERPRRAAAAVIALYGLAMGALVLGYPVLRGVLLGRVYTAATLAVVAVLVAASASWWRRRERPDLTIGSVWVLGAIEFGAVFAWRVPFTGWDFAMTLYLVAHVALLVLHLGDVAWPQRTSA